MDLEITVKEQACLTNKPFSASSWFQVSDKTMCTLKTTGKSLTDFFSHFLFQEHLPELYVHFQSQSFHTSMYASSWFLTIFLTTFPLPIATRIFDIFMSEVTTQCSHAPFQE